MKKLLLNGTPDPTNQNQNQLIFYAPNTELAARSDKFVLTGKADTCDYTWGEAGGRKCLDIVNSTANSAKLTYSLHPSSLPPEALRIPSEPFSWTIAIWVYVGPEDFTANISISNPNNGQYLATVNFLSKTAQEAGTTVDKRQMRIWIGRGSTTTLAIVLGRYHFANGSWTTLKANKSSNLTMNKGWHLVWVRPQTTRSTLVWGIDKEFSSNVTSFFNATDDWTEDFYIGSDICVSSGEKTNNLPRGPLRVYKNIISTADLATLYENDIW